MTEVRISNNRGMQIYEWTDEFGSHQYYYHYHHGDLITESGYMTIHFFFSKCFMEK